MEWELEWMAASVTGRVRADNQDAWLIWSPGDGAAANGVRRFDDFAGRAFAAAVADGMGGAPGGGEASTLIVMTAREELERAAEETEPAEFLQALAERCRTAVIAKSRSQARPGMGSTFTLILIANNAVHLLHVGDSRCYRCRPLAGELRQWSRDHNLAAEWVAEGRLLPEEAAVNPGRHLLTQAVSDGSKFDPQIETLSLAAEEQVFLICSDGLHGVVTDAEILAAIRPSPEPLATMLAGLIDLADSRGSPDNVSVILARMRPLA